MQIKKRKKIKLNRDRNKTGPTERYEAFADEYIMHFNGTKAAIAAGYSKRSATMKGSQLLRDPRVIKIVEQKLAERAKRIELDQDRIIYDLEDVRRKSIKGGQYAVAVRATELQGKHLNMFGDRLKIGFEEEFYEKIAEAGQSLQIVLRRFEDEKEKD